MLGRSELSLPTRILTETRKEWVREGERKENNGPVIVERYSGSSWFQSWVIRRVSSSMANTQFNVRIEAFVASLAVFDLKTIIILHNNANSTLDL